MNFVIVGGGPTGVELAGALAEMKKGILPKDYPDLDIRQMQINLIQSSECLLQGMSAKASEKAEDFLIGLGVNIWKNLRVLNYDGKIVTTNGHDNFKAETVIWAAGVKGENIKGLDALSIIPRVERYKVNNYNQIDNYANIYAIGDVACMQSEANPYGHPMMAQPAIQQGKLVAKNILAKLFNKKQKAFFIKSKFCRSNTA